MSPSGSPATPDQQGRWRAPYAVNLTAVLGPYLRGATDPVALMDGDAVAWRACRTPEGPGTLRIEASRDSVTADAWGDGAGWLVASVPDLLGFEDVGALDADLLPSNLGAVWRRVRDRWRVPRSGLVLEALLAAILEQKVTGVQSRRSWRSLVVATGSRAPGPTPRPMFVLGEVAQLRQVPSWQWHRWGVTPHQSAAVLRALAAAGRLAECADLPHEGARRRLTSIPGIGEWTAAEVGQRALGDPDAVSFGDFHLAHHVVYAFTGEMDGADERMADLLAPFAGQRYRVQRLVELSGISRPARGPRMTIADHRRH